MTQGSYTSHKPELSPASDWRIVAEMVKDYPPCANCGNVYGNAYFGAAHASSNLNIPGVCTGYVPEDKSGV